MNLLHKLTGSILIVLELAACSDSSVKTEVKSMLIDPSSAEFRSITVFENGNYCGEVNAKNRMGGYVGHKAFRKVDGVLEIEDIYNLDYVCEIAKNPLAYKCKNIKSLMDYYSDKISKTNPASDLYSQWEFEKNKGEKIKYEKEYKDLMCLK